jgi:hypothetical protein
MIAGDDNDVFTAQLDGFLSGLAEAPDNLPRPRHSG